MVAGEAATRARTFAEMGGRGQTAGRGEDDVLAETKRLDGSVRRARKIRPGYRPQEELPAYVPPHRRGALPGAAADADGALEEALAKLAISAASRRRYELIDGHYEVVDGETGDRVYDPCMKSGLISEDSTGTKVIGHR